MRRVSASKSCLQNKPETSRFEGPTYRSGKKVLIPFPRYLNCVLASAPKSLTSTEDEVMMEDCYFIAFLMTVVSHLFYDRYLNKFIYYDSINSYIMTV